jgi:hypothetical protein
LHIECDRSRQRPESVNNAIAAMDREVYVNCASHPVRLRFGVEGRAARKRTAFTSMTPRYRRRGLEPKESRHPDGFSEITVHPDEPPPPHL